MKDQMQMLTTVTEEVRAEIMATHARSGLELAPVLIAVQAQVAAMLVLELGGDTTATTLRDAAAQVEGKPSLSDLALALSTPVGRA